MELQVRRFFKVEKFHAGIVPKSTLFKVLQYCDKERIQTPLLLIDSERLRENISRIGRGLEGCSVFYALKANPDPAIAELASRLDVGFEIASEGELQILSSLGIGPERIISSNPVKSLKFLEAAKSYGVGYFSFDSRDEVEKMAKFVPGSNVYVRLSVPNEGSDWPLSKKFGVELEEALRLLSYAREKNLHPVGITFHVGSQCTNPYNWNIAIDKARILWDMAASRGLELSLLNIGGGYPINYTRSVVDIETIEKNIRKALSEKFPNRIQVHLEPGRAVVGDAGMLVSSVIGKAKRQDKDWLYIDVGVFNGLMESLGGIRYTYLVESVGAREKKWTIGGPSCDSFDVIDKNVPLPEPDIGRLILILSAGAYTISYASEFNGFSIPKTLLI
jgi:ornithine decarboxylase